MPSYTHKHRSHDVRHDEHGPLLEGDGPRPVRRRDLGDACFQLPIGEAGEGRPSASGAALGMGTLVL